MNDNLEAIRKARGLTYYKLTKELNDRGLDISLGTVRNYCKMKTEPTHSQAIKIAEFFNKPVDYFYR